ncbi:MAG: DUF4906 domain-containing protein [Bacteroidaceae bacterium]|nr:DUF4906 domain-containing protein [Bacteroidaceae bacterium]
MKRIGLYICSLLLALCACTDTAFMQDVRREIEVCLNFSTVQSGSETKASMEVTPLESTQVRNVWVMQFDGTAGSSRLLLAKYYANYVPGTKIKLLTSDVENNLLFIVNTNNPNLEFSKCQTQDDVKNFRLYVSTDTQAAGEYYGDCYNMIMNGHVQAVVNGASLLLNVPLMRNSVRLDVKITNATGGTENPITIDSVGIYSGVVYMDYYTDYTLPELYPSKYEEKPLAYPATAWSEGLADGTSRRFTFYCPANKRGSAQTTDPKHKLFFAPNGITYLQIWGTDSQGIRVTYKFALGADLISDCNLLPNTDYSYEFTISSPGDYATDSRAENLNMQDFTQAPLANSYMIHPPSVKGVWKSVRIPVKRIYDFWNPTDGYEKVPANALNVGSYGWRAEIIRSSVELVEDVNFKWIKREGNDYTDYFEFAITEGVEGNIILGVHRYTDMARTLLDDVFLWSWHMWVTDYDPDIVLPLLTPEVDASGNDTRFVYTVLKGEVNRFSDNIWKTGAELDGQYMMDRNLGALSQTERHGPGTLYYQWGRKDPFMYASSMNQAPTKGVVIYNRYNDALEFPFRTLAQLQAIGSETDLVRYAVYHPDTYLLIAEWTNSDIDDYAGIKYIVSGNWRDPKLGSSKTPDLRAKSIFDPCPPGWKVPAQGSMTFPTGTVTSTVNNISISTLPNGAVIYRPVVGYSAFGGPSNNYTYSNNINYWTNRVPNGGSQPYIMIGNTTNSGLLIPVRCVSFTEP